MKEILKQFNKKVFIITLTIWTILNASGIQNFYFNESVDLKIISIKILHFFFLYGIFSKIYNLYLQRKTSKGKRQIISTLIYFVILTILLISSWPGLWSEDDILIVRKAQIYDLSQWQHFFSGLFHILALQTIPIASGVLIIQIILASLIVGYCVSTISELYGKTKKQATIIQILLLLITLFPPLTSYILSGFRMGMYSFVEMLLITKMICVFKEKNKIDLANLLKISFLIIIVSCWRTEGIYYPIFILILYFILGKKVINKKTATITILAITIINFSIGKLNNLMIGTNNYSLITTMEPVVSVMKANKEIRDEQIEKINKVLDVEIMKQKLDKTSERIFWTEGVVKEYTEDEYSDYLKTCIELILKYPETVIQGKWNLFVKAVSGIGENGKRTTRNMTSTHINTLQLFDRGSGAGGAWYYLNSELKNPINSEIREKTILFLCGVDAEDNLTIIHNVFWNLSIPLALILISLIYKLMKKDWFMVFLILTVIARVPIVFITAPAPYFMYYLSVYLCSYEISFIVIFEMITSRKKRKNEEKKELVIYRCKILKQLLSFLKVSGIGWLIDFSIYIILTKLIDFKVGFANILSSIPAITYVFIMSNKEIFKNDNSKLSLKIKYLIYFGYQLILLFSISLLGEFLYSKLINFVEISFLLNNLKIIIKILITPITMTINFIVMKNLVEKL